MKPSFHIPLRKKTGISLIELLVGAVLFLGISAGAYKVFTSSTQISSETQKSTKQTRLQKQFFDRFRSQVGNTVQLPRAMGTALQLERREICWQTDGKERYMGWGLIPYPGHSRQQMDTAQTSLNSIYPPNMTVNDTDRANDAIRMVYIPDNTVVHYLALSAGLPLPTNGSNPIVIEGVASDLAQGDFAIVADSMRQDLIRITNITNNGSQTSIYHGAGSVWNSLWTGAAANYNYGHENLQQLGRPVVYKVKIITYALDEETNTLMVDNHTGDDGFVQPTTWGTPGLAQRWEAVSPNINQFQIFYTRIDNAETRQPQPGLPGMTYESCSASANPPANCGCQNELGNPGIKNIRINLTYTNPNSVEQLATLETFNPTLLKKGIPFVGTDHPGCNATEALYTTQDNGSPYEECTENKYCLCSARPGPPSGGGTPPVVTDPGYGGGAG